MNWKGHFMDFNVCKVSNTNLLRPEKKELKQNFVAFQQDRANYNEAALDRMAMLNRSMVRPKTVSFGGWKPESENNAEVINKMAKVIKSPEIKKIAVSGHLSPDGDSIGSCIACASLLHKATGKDVDCFIFGNLPKRYEFLKENMEGINIIEVQRDKATTSKSLEQKHGKYDLAVSVDTSETHLISPNYYYGIFEKAKNTFKIDHHPYVESEKDGKKTDNNFAQLNLVDTSCGAATQLLMQFAEPLGINPKELSHTFSNAVYTGLLTDTGGLKFSQNALAFTDAALLIQNGVNNREMQNYALGNTPMCVRTVTNLATEKTQFSKDGKIAYLIEDDELAAAKKAAKDEGYFQEAKDAIKGVAGAMPDIKGVEIGFKVTKFANKASFSVRSLHADVSEIARSHGGGGHKNACAFQVALDGRTMEETVQAVIEEYQKTLEEQGY